MASMGDVESASWLVSRQCGICQGLAREPVSIPCCSSAACKPCVDKHLQDNSCCWVCEIPIEDKEIPIDKEIQEGIELIITSLLSCCICREACHRAVCLPCCEGGSVCRGCGIKAVTSSRSCWTCNKAGIRSEDLNTDKLLREALTYHKENKEHSSELLNKLFIRKISFLKEQLARKEKSEAENDAKVNDGEDENESGEVMENGKENGEEEEEEEGEEPDEDEEKKEKEKESKEKEEPPSKKRERSPSRERRREKKKKHKEEHRRDEKRKRKQRDRSRNRSRDRRSRSRDRERRNKKHESTDKHVELIKKENGVGSLGALQKRIRIENEIVEKKVKDKIEEYISSMVAQQLRVRKGEIEKEVLEKVDLARQNMEEEVKLEIDLMRKARETEEKAKMDEMNARMAEKEEALANERKKLAEDRLKILENQMKIEKEKQREKKKQEKKVKQEQMKILGKDKSRPKLSFSLTKN